LGIVGAAVPAVKFQMARLRRTLKQALRWCERARGTPEYGRQEVGLESGP